MAASALAGAAASDLASVVPAWSCVGAGALQAERHNTVVIRPDTRVGVRGDMGKDRMGRVMAVVLVP